MNRKEYLEALGKELGAMSYKDVNDILDEINGHFTEGITKGKTEEQIAEGLGSPEELAAMYRDGMNLPQIMTKRSRRTSPDRAEADGTGKLFVILFNCFAGVWGWLILLFAIFVAMAVLVGAAALAVIMVVSMITGAIPSYLLLPSILFTVTLVLAGIFLYAIVFLGIKYYIRGVKSYIRWNKNIWNYGFGGA